MQGLRSVAARSVPAGLSAALLAVSLHAQQGEPLPPPAAPARPAIKLVAAPAPQEPSQEELKKWREEKLAKPVFRRAPWLFSFEEAKQKAAAEDELILVYFTRSYSP